MLKGAVETERGFVLHSADFFIENSTLLIDEGVCLTATLDILKAIAAAMVRRARSWRSATPAGRRASSRTAAAERLAALQAGPDLIFGADVGAKYDRAMQKIGIRPGMLSSDVGHA